MSMQKAPLAGPEEIFIFKSRGAILAGTASVWEFLTWMIFCMVFDFLPIFRSDGLFNTFQMSQSYRDPILSHSYPAIGARSELASFSLSDVAIIAIDV